MKKITLIPCLLLFLFSCQTIKKTDDVNTQETPYFDPNYKYVQMIPDSLRTDEQKELANKLQKVVSENQKVVNNQLVFTLTKDEFVAKGIPEEYFILIQKDIVNNNKFFKDNNIQNVDSLFKESNKNKK